MFDRNELQKRLPYVDFSLVLDEDLGLVEFLIQLAEETKKSHKRDPLTLRWSDDKKFRYYMYKTDNNSLPVLAFRKDKEDNKWVMRTSMFSQLSGAPYEVKQK